MEKLDDQSAAGPIATGVLRLHEAQPNPMGNIDRLFRLRGNGIDATITRIEQADLIPDLSGYGRLRVFHFNDLHNHLTELSGPAKGTRRFSQMVKTVRWARAEARETDALLFLSIGDDHTGSMLDELVGWNEDQFVLDPSYRAYSDAGIDATVLGNHEFDRGSALLARGIRQDARFPVLSANVHSSRHLICGSDYSAGAIATVGNLRIGLLGLTTHVETRVGQASDPTLAVASPVTVIEHILPALAPLVDVILILSHCGYGDGAHKSGKAAAIRDIGEADFSLARMASKLTRKPLLVLGAHTHTKLNEFELDSANIIDGIPIFQTECNGRYLGEIDLLVDPAASGGYTIRKACLHPVKPHQDSPEAVTLEPAEYEQPTDFDREFENQTIAPILAKISHALNNSIASVCTDRLSFQSGVLSRYTGASDLVNFICDSIFTRMAGLGYDVDFALMNGATIQAGVEPGVLTAGNWFDVMPYADEIFIVQLTGTQLSEMLQSNAKRVLRPDEISQTDYTGFLARGFFHTSTQIRYRIELGRSAAEARAVDAEFCGRSLNGLRKRKFNIVMSTYLALGGFGERWNGQPICGGVPGDLAGFDLRAMPSQNTGLVYRDEVAEQLRAIQPIHDGNAVNGDGRLKIAGKAEAEMINDRC